MYSELFFPTLRVRSRRWNIHSLACGELDRSAHIEFGFCDFYLVMVRLNIYILNVVRDLWLAHRI